MFRIQRRSAVLGLVVAVLATLAALLVGSAGATGSAPVQRRDIVVRQVDGVAPSVNLTADDPGAVHGKLSAPIELETAQSSAADRAPVAQLADDPTPPPAEPDPVEPPATTAPAPPPPLINTPEPTATPPASPENTPIQTPILAPQD